MPLFLLFQVSSSYSCIEPNCRPPTPPQEAEDDEEEDEDKEEEMTSAKKEGNGKNLSRGYKTAPLTKVDLKEKEKKVRDKVYIVCLD